MPMSMNMNLLDCMAIALKNTRILRSAVSQRLAHLVEIAQHQTLNVASQK